MGLKQQRKRRRKQRKQTHHPDLLRHCQLLWRELQRLQLCKLTVAAQIEAVLLWRKQGQLSKGKRELSCVVRESSGKRRTEVDGGSLVSSRSKGAGDEAGGERMAGKGGGEGRTEVEQGVRRRSPGEEGGGGGWVRESGGKGRRGRASRLNTVHRCPPDQGRRQGVKLSEGEGQERERERREMKSKRIGGTKKRGRMRSIGVLWVRGRPRGG